MLVALWVRVGVLEAPPRNMRSRDWSSAHKVFVHLVNDGWEETSRSACWHNSVSLRSVLMQDQIEYLAAIRMRWSAPGLEMAMASVTFRGFGGLSDALLRLCCRKSLRRCGWASSAGAMMGPLVWKPW